MELTLRITVLAPPPGVRFRVQSGRKNLEAPSQETAAALSFEIPMRVAPREPNQPPRLLGPFAQGPPASRFVYVNSGQSAGQPATPWARRAKVPLTGITWALIDEALAKPGAVIETRIHGTGRDGGPVCASVKGVEWRVVFR